MALEIADKEFEDMVRAAMDDIPEQYASHMHNVGFVVEDEPTPEQRGRLRLHDGATLYGLYEGVPLTARTNNYSGVLPDKITIFKKPMLSQAKNLGELNKQIRNTIWHEVAHYFGLNHQRISELEKL